MNGAFLHRIYGQSFQQSIPWVDYILMAKRSFTYGNFSLWYYRWKINQQNQSWSRDKFLLASDIMISVTRLFIITMQVLISEIFEIHKKMCVLFKREFKWYTYTANVNRNLRGSHRFFLQYLWKRAVRITEKLYTPQNILYVVVKPCNIYRLQGKL